MTHWFFFPDDHHHDDDEEEEGGATKEAPEDDAAPKSTFKVDEIIPIVDSILEQDDKVSLSVFFAITDNVFEEKFTFQRFICLFFRIRTGTSTGLSLSPGKSRDSSVLFFLFFWGNLKVIRSVVFNVNSGLDILIPL